MLSQFILLVESLQIFNCNSLYLYFHVSLLILLLSRHYYYVVRAKLTFNNVEC